MSTFLVLFGVHVMAVVSPGPDFFLVARCSLSGKQSETMTCCLGIASGVATHLLLTYFGLSALISQSKWMYSMIVILGGLWLFKMALSGLFAKSESWTALQPLSFSSHWNALKNGYLTNLLNPKAWIFFVNVMSPLVQQGWSGWSFFALAFVITIWTLIWFVLVATLLNQGHIKRIFQKYQAMIDKLFALVILCFAFFISYSELSRLFF